MKLTTLFILVVITTLSSCGARNNHDHSGDGSFYVNEKLIAKGELLITLPKERPENFAIQTPKGEWFVLQDSSDSIEIMPQSRFNSIKTMQFEVSTLMGAVWRDGVKSKEYVFQYSGTYLIYFANNLETEPENTFSFQQSIVYP